MPLLLAGSLSIAILTSIGQSELLNWRPGVLDRYTQQMEQVWSGGGLWAVALLPGICEELLFRGAILGLLGRRGRWIMAVLLQALLFGLVHIFAFKLLPTAAIGLLLGILAVRCGSVWPGVVLHLAHNTTMFLLGTHLTLTPDEALLLGMSVAAAVGFGAAWWSGSGGGPQAEHMITPIEPHQSRHTIDKGT